MSEKSYTSLEERVYQLEKETIEADYQISGPKIQRVPIFLRQNAEFAKYCTPKMISFGPIHHGNENLKQGEHYKHLWTCQYLEEYCKESGCDSKQKAAQVLHKKIEDDIKVLKKLFTEDAIRSHEKDLPWILFVDGCALLYFMRKINDHHPQALKLKLDQLMYMWRDILLLENQLPLKVLKLLTNDKGPNLEDLMRNFLTMGYYLNRHINQHLGCRQYICQVFENILAHSYHPLKEAHLLDRARSSLLSCSVDVNDDNDKDDEGENLMIWQTYKNLRDLKTAGIRVMPNKLLDKHRNEWGNISFTPKWFYGELRLPLFEFNDITLYFFHNLIALEICPDYETKFQCCSFFSFMDSLIDSAEDVKELRRAGVIQNLLGSDEELAKFINDLGTDLHTKMYNFGSTCAVAYSRKYIRVKRQIEKHYKNKWRTWLAQAYNTHFNSPWTMVAFLAAILALVLTFIQTWYCIYPKN